MKSLFSNMIGFSLVAALVTFAPLAQGQSPQSGKANSTKKENSKNIYVTHDLAVKGKAKKRKASRKGFKRPKNNYKTRVKNGQPMGIKRSKRNQVKNGQPMGLKRTK